MDDYFAAIELNQGFVSRTDVLAAGHDDRFIRRQLASRQWTRIRNGAYCSTARWTPLDPIDRHRRLARAVLKAHGDGVVLSKVSALSMRPGVDVWGVDLTRVHVTRRDGRSGSVERDVVHHEGPVSDDDVEEIDGLLVMREDRCVVETVAAVGVEPGLVIADSALHQGRVTREALVELREQNKRWRGSRTADLVLRMAEPKAESVGESRSRFLYWSQGFPRPVVQFPVFEDGVLVGTTDLAWPCLGLLFEFDGRVKYGRLLKPGQTPGDAVFAEKKREDALRRATGYALERATWVDLSHPVETARRARARISGPRHAG
jgi:hypothetical protein